MVLIIKNWKVNDTESDLNTKMWDRLLHTEKPKKKTTDIYVTH